MIWGLGGILKGLFVAAGYVYPTLVARSVDLFGTMVFPIKIPFAGGLDFLYTERSLESDISILHCGVIQSYC